MTLVDMHEDTMLGRTFVEAADLVKCHVLVNAEGICIGQR
jgi:hypothetical protein